MKFHQVFLGRNVVIFDSKNSVFFLDKTQRISGGGIWTPQKLRKIAEKLQKICGKLQVFCGHIFSEIGKFVVAYP